MSETLVVVCRCIYGGAPKGPQVRDLRNGVEVVIATPGTPWSLVATCPEAEAIHSGRSYCVADPCLSEP